MSGRSLQRAPLSVAVLLVFGLVLAAPTHGWAQQVLHRANAGASFTANGNTWAPLTDYKVAGQDETSSHGQPSTIDSSVPSGTPSQIWETERWDPSQDPEMQYEFDVPSGTQVEVRLYVYDGYSGTSAPGDRVFDVILEGQTVLSNFDIIDTYGNDTGAMESFTVTSDGTVDLDFGHVTENPQINAVEILDVQPQPDELGGPGSVDFGTVIINNSNTEQVTVTNLGDTGDPTITVDGATVSGADASAFSTSFAGGTTLSPGESTDIPVTFSPTDGQAKSASLDISHSGSNSPLTVFLSGEGASDVPVGFGKSDLQGFGEGSLTALEFGPDDRLYVAQQNGMVYALDLARNGENSYSVTSQESVSAVQNIPNHDDTGTYVPGETTRQITGLTVGGTASQPVVYVSSSDPTIDVGTDDDDTDTNSGTISRLTFNWDGSGTLTSVDHTVMVLGLPRSEENHATNGLDLSDDGNTLYVAQGGHTNKGGPGDNFGHTPEYALSAAVLTIDLAQIENNNSPQSLQSFSPDGGGTYPDIDFLYALPTIQGGPLPFGGNDGINQAKWVENGPVQVYSPGYRNPYDLVLSADDQLYVIDNGPNGGWGGQPVNEGQNGQCTNAPNESGSYGTGDQLHLATEGAYGGHATPIRANPTGADIYDAAGNMIFDITASNTPVPSSLANPIECDYQDPTEDNSLGDTFGWTGGIAEYTASNFGGDMQGNLLVVVGASSVERVELNAAGDAVTNQESNFFSASSALGIAAQGDTEKFPGTVWTARGGIKVFEPNDFDGGGQQCSAADDASLDEDNDGFDNADEIDNGTDPCSAASTPADFDGDLISNLNDPDDDNDGTPDTEDPFALDADNGTTTSLPIQMEFVATDLFGDSGQGWDGLMTNGQDDYMTLYDPTQMVVGGAAQVLTVEDVPAGDATNNDQQFAFQRGVNVPDSPFTLSTTVNGYPSNPSNFHGLGLYIGTGDQDNYLKLIVSANGGTGGLEFAKEVNGTFQGVAQPDDGAVTGPGTNTELFMTVDPTTDPTPNNGSDDVAVTAEYAVNGGSTTEVGTGSIPASWLDASDGTAPAVGVISTSYQAGSTFNATWTDLTVEATPSDAATLVQITPGSGVDASTFSGGSFVVENTSSSASISSLTFDASTAALMDLVFDPDGTAGDGTAKGFTLDSESGDGVSVTNSSFSGSKGNGGFEQLTVEFDDFEAGETMEFSADMDPTSIEGTSAPGPGESGSVSGVELTGTTVTVTYDDGTSQTVEPFRVSGSDGGAENTAKSPSAPAISDIGVDGVSLSSMGRFQTATVDASNQTVQVDAPDGSTVRLLQMEAGLYEPSGGATGLDPFEANTVTAVSEQSKTVSGTNGVLFDVSLSANDALSGATTTYNYLVAAIEDGDGHTGPTSNILVLEQTPDAQQQALFRVNAGGSAYTDGDGNTWEADSENNYFTNGSTYSISDDITGTQDDPLYQTERYGDGFTYSFPVSNGSYDVVLHFAELFHGVSGNGNCSVDGDCTGARLFSVNAEGQTVLSDYDIYAEAGASAAAVTETLSGIQVSDGTLDLEFFLGENGIDNGKVSAISVFPAEPSSATPQALVTVNEGGGLDASTYPGGAFEIQNTGDVPIENVSLDLSTGYLPDVVFDPDGTAGDAAGKCLTPDGGASATGFVSPGDPCTDPYSQPHNGTNSENGYDVLSASFSDFGGGESFAFSADIDPLSIKEQTDTGDAGSISGFEMIGSTVTVEFANGDTHTATLWDEGSLGGSQAVVAPDLPQAPSIGVQDASPPATVSGQDQTIEVTGPAGATVSLLQMDARLYIDQDVDPDGDGEPGYDTQPFEANEALAKTLGSVTLDGTGTGTIDVSLLETSMSTGPDGGLNHFIAVTEGAGQQVSPASNSFVLEYDPTAQTAQIAGTVSYYGGSPMIENAEAALSGGASQTVSSGASGTFQLSASTGQSYSLSATKAKPSAAADANGVTTLDLALARQDVLNIQALPSPYHILAGDVNADGGLSTLDLALVRQLILDLRDGFADAISGEAPAGRTDLWQCAVSGLSQAGYDGSYSYAPLSGDQSGQDFHCFRLGDLNGSWSPPSGQQTLAQAQSQGHASAQGQDGAQGQTSAQSQDGAQAHAAARTSGPTLRLRAEDVETAAPAQASTSQSASPDAASSEATASEAAAGEASTVLVPIRAEAFEDVGGLQFTLEWDPEVLSYQGVETARLEGFSPANLNTKRAEEGLLGLAWAHPEAKGQSLPEGQALLKVRFRAQGGRTAEAGQETTVEFSSRLAALGAHRTSASGSGGGRTFTPAPVRTEAATVRRAERPETFVLEGAYPNPSRGRLTLSMDLPQAAEVTVDVYDVLGRKVLTRRTQKAAGKGQAVRLDASRLTSGLYLYRVRAKTADGTHAADGKLTLVK